MPDYTGGFTGAVNTASEMQSRAVMDALRAQQIRGLAMEAEKAQRAQQARQGLGGVLQLLMGGGAGAGAPQTPQMPAPPGTAAGGPMPPGVGVPSVPSAPQGAPGPDQVPPPPAAQGGAQAAPAAPAPAAPIPIPPFRPLPASAPAAPGGDPTIPAPPAPAAAIVKAQEDVPQPSPINLKAVLAGFKAAGVPQEKWMDMLDELQPVMNAQNKQELDFFKANNAALKAANDIYLKTLQANIAGRKVDVLEDAEARRTTQGDRKLDQGDERLALLRRKAASAAGGSENLKTTELIYPKGADGQPDQSKPPIGVRGITKTGKIITLDADGKSVTAAELTGGTAKEAKATAGGKDAVRSSIVKGGVVNALNRLDEIEKVHPKATTSVFFGQHADNPVTRGLYGVGQGMQDKKQQDVDAKWAAFIDEAIPVFTGGLRGSDAFRRFLIEQAPGPGARPETIKEKMRLFRENIQGTSKAFFGKFSADPTMWPPGVTKEQVEAVKGGGGAGSPAPQQYTEGQTATNDKGEKIVFRGGKWTPQ